LNLIGIMVMEVEVHLNYIYLFEQLRDLINELYDKKSLQKERLQIQINLLNEIIANNSDNYIVNKSRELELELNNL
jgi:hypothetical protein